MDTSYYLTVNASSQGELVGEGGKKTNAKGIPILGYSLGVDTPQSSGSGQATGKRTYEPVSVYKNAGPVTVQIYQALTNNEMLLKVEILVYKTTKAGKESLYFKITLTNARISALQHEPGDTVDQDELETIQFTFQKIELENLLAGTSVVDDLKQTA
jgi:type VI secretion system Hcp family effector